MEDIDIVVLWCDGDDPAFKAKKEKYLNRPLDENDESAGAIRTRDMGTFPFWFRAIEENMPWVRKVHLVTDEQVPDWLAVEHPKLHLVDLKDFIPSQYLPLFNSCAIEIFIHRIEGLAEQFIYFNDDMFVNAPCSPQDFFLKGKPRLCPFFTNRFPMGDSPYYYHIYNNMRVANHYCRSRRVALSIIPRSIGRQIGFDWSCKNTALLLATAFAMAGFPYVKSPHQALPMTRTIVQQIWAHATPFFDKTAGHRFREDSDISQELFYDYAIYSGNFELSHRKECCYTMDADSVACAVEDVKGALNQMICINDAETSEFQQLVMMVKEAFVSRYPNPCSFEKKVN